MTRRARRAGHDPRGRAGAERAGAAAGGIGPALADLLSGYAVYAPGTLVIKGAMGLLAAALYRRLGGRALGVALCAVPAEALMVAGYWLFDSGLAFAGGGGTWALCLTAGAAGGDGADVAAADAPAA